MSALFTVTALPEATVLLKLLMPIEPLLNIHVTSCILSAIDNIIAPMYNRISPSVLFNNGSPTHSTSFSPEEENQLENIVFPLISTCVNIVTVVLTCILFCFQ